ncbi:hypothetical protein QQS21_010538 [Conoideocrella luteorostrata]|uniref:Casein kinase II beta 2 subunit n=1 Tax=Conoideocrella luteorostrata TaxID=1105319 RepID=A0AAJ0FU44_9HYPO|nr:hypothetical protein QQS21_010538 [Conoideocrella luteorostrata]
MASHGVIWGPAALRLLRVAMTKTSKAVRHKLADVAKPFQHELQAIPRYTGRQPIHPAALLKQQKRGPRWLSGAAIQDINHVVRRFITSGRSPSGRFDRSKLPSSNTSRRVGQFSGRAPFASTLRPNLTGGAMPRTAGGYSLGGGARYFSHTPAAPAQVVQNVSQAMRAFFLSGQKIRYDGTGPRGERQYRTVSGLEDNAMSKLSAIPRWAPGSFIDFQISPTVTAMSPLAAAIACAPQPSGFHTEAATHLTCLDTEGFLDVLSADFGRALQDLAIVYSDIRRLSALGSLPAVMEKGDTIRVRFPGVDAFTVERLCDDIGIQRGIIGQDPDFDATMGVTMALKFPFAPESEETVSSPGGSARSLEGSRFDDAHSSSQDDSFVRDAFVYEVADDSPWLTDSEGYGTMSPPDNPGGHRSDDFEGLEGVYRFLAECDQAQGRLG